MKYQRLFQPITIHGMALKNRIVMPPIHLLYSMDGSATEKFKEFYYRRAEGGVGLIICGGCQFDDYGGTLGMISLQKDELIPSFQAFTDGIHARGAKVAVQLYHGGRYSSSRFLPAGKKPLSASATTSTFTHEQAREMTKRDIFDVIDHWAAAAARAKRAGFDAVEILGSAGYLICQFLSPLTNLRKDEYGGSWENRVRFPLEVISAVRAAVGPDYPLIMRISGNDFMSGSNTNSEAVKFARLIERAGINLINVTGGWHETTVPQLPGEVPLGCFTYLAEAIKQAVSIPVLACNRLNTPKVCETVLARGQSDLVGLCRPLLADPDWPQKVAENRLDEIRYCVGCNQGCLAHAFFAKPVACLVNGEAGHEADRVSLPAEKKKDVLVVGSGPAGLEFAVEAAKRRHNITIWEQSNKLGGQLNLAAKPIGRNGFHSLKQYYENMVLKLNISIKFNTEATPEKILEAAFDEIIIATGAVPKTIIPSTIDSSATLMTAEQVLSGECIPGKHIVLVGGGAVGCETAQLMARDSSLTPEQLYFLLTNRAEKMETLHDDINHSDRSIAIVEKASRIGHGFSAGCAWPVLNDIKRLGVQQYTSAQLREVVNGIAYIEQEIQGEVREVKIPCDTVVVSIGYTPETALYQALCGKVPQLHLLGDADRVGNIMDAIRQSYDLAHII